MKLIDNDKIITSSIQILITGINGTLGQIIASELIKNENFLIIGTDSHEKLQFDLSASISYYPCNLARSDEVMQLADAIGSEYGGIHVLINNAAVRDFGPFDLFPSSRITETMQVNLDAPLLLINRFVPFMKQKQFGRIINISSPSAFEYYEQGWLYCTSKAALAGLAKYTGKETIRSGISIHTIYPQSFIKRDGIKLHAFQQTTKKVARQVLKIIGSAPKKRFYVAGDFFFTVKLHILNWLRYV